MFVVKQILVFVSLLFFPSCCSFSVTDYGEQLGIWGVRRSWTPHRLVLLQRPQADKNVYIRGDELEHVYPTGAIRKLMLTEEIPVSEKIIYHCAFSTAVNAV